MLKKRLGSLVTVSVFGVTLLAYQNCSNVQFTDEGTFAQDIPSLSNGCDSNSSLCGAPEELTCVFDGKTYEEGQSVTAYLNSSAPNGGSCQVETRVCRSGSLSGTYSYSQCEINAPSACLFDAKTILHGASVTAYKTSSVSYGSVCVSESRVCNNGVLSGSNSFATCSVGSAPSCLFNGQTIAHGGTVTAFSSGTAPAGQSCASQVRTCNAGTLSGSYQFSSCAAGVPRSCLFNGQTIANGQTIIAYAGPGSSEQGCIPQYRTCNNGVLSGSYTYSSCSVGQPAAASTCNYTSAKEYWGNSDNKPVSACYATIPSHQNVQPIGAQYHFMSENPYWHGSLVSTCVLENGRAVIKEVSRNCAQRVRCPAGTESVNHNGVVCTYSWGEASWTGNYTTVQGTNGGSITAFCEQTGQWSNIVRRCNGL